MRFLKYMKATGVVRPIDGLGRIVLPAELRKIMGLDAKDFLEIFLDEDKIVLKKYQKSCIFCKNEDDLLEFKDRCVCKSCLKEIKKR